MGRVLALMKLVRFFLGALGALVIIVIILLGGFRANAWLQESQDAVVAAPASGRFVKTTEGVVHVTIWGAKNPRTVLFTHGMAAWGGLWQETAEKLAEHGYQVIAMDQPPFGFSDRSNPDFSRSRQAARLKATAVSLGLRDYTLVGHSYGGGVALEAALRYPTGMKALVLVCPVINLREPGEPAAGSAPALLRITTVAESLVSASITNPLLTGFLTKRFMHRKDALTEDHIAILQKPMSLKGNTRFMVEWLKQFLAGDPNAVSRDRREVSKLRVPVSFIWGEKDTVTPIQQGQALSAIVKPETFSRLSEVGHMPQLEVPDLFNQTLLKALSGLGGIENPRLLSDDLRGSI